MLSRVANTIYWLGRYMERTNGMLQVILTQYISSPGRHQQFYVGTASENIRGTFDKKNQ